jgi:hypothetical protein
LVWDKPEHEVSEADVVESTMQLWGFVDLLGVVAITQDDLEVIMARCSPYIVELYVHLRLLYARNRNIVGGMQECMAIFKQCCAALAQIERQYYNRCGLFCVILTDMRARVANTATHSQN